MTRALLAVATLLVAIPLVAQELVAQGEDFRAYTESPRLLLKPQRLRLLKRERERQSIRWMQFDTLISGRVAMAEPGFAFALYSQITEKPEYCREAARVSSKDLRQVALVYDWCQAEALVAPLKQGAERLAASADLSSIRTRAFAALALADVDSKWSEATMRDIVVRWWRGTMVPSIRKGTPVERGDFYALFELLHVVRDNLNIDLRDPVQGFFRDLPILDMLSYYPASYPGPQNEFRVPYYQQDGEPDLQQAAMARAAELAMVAFDNNSMESQALQSWVLQDRYLMRGPFGIVYEFLWANPYQPGITYHVLPNVFHDKAGGRLYLRSNWEEDATFFCYDNGKGQVFEAGKRADVNVAAQKKPIRVGAATILVGKNPMSFETGYSLDQPLEQGEKRPEETWFIVGLKRNAPYDVEPDDEEMSEARTDAGGILSLQYPKPRKMTVRVHEPGPPGPASQ